jgi:hypothetical protein
MSDKKPMTVGELKRFLENKHDAWPVFLMHEIELDRGPIQFEVPLLDHALVRGSRGRVILIGPEESK